MHPATENESMKRYSREAFTVSRNGTPAPGSRLSRFFYACGGDGPGQLLKMSYGLRYQVYCVERGFLPACDYLDGLESDEFDAHSLHFGVCNTAGELVATARLVQASHMGFPMQRHCVLFDEMVGDIHEKNVVEISRLAVSRNYRRRKDDGLYGLRNPPGSTNGQTAAESQERRSSENAVFYLYQSIYQASKRAGITHWLAAMERALQRLLFMYGFPFRPIGPEADYFGPITPYIMALADFDRNILDRRIPLLANFLADLEPQYHPQQQEIPD
jgi:N-acyl amino acid synthase of PEP-CTERM/exosortase system